MSDEIKQSTSDRERLREFLEEQRSEVSSEEEELFYGDDPIAKRYMQPLIKYIYRDDIENIKEIIINQPEEITIEYADGTWEFLEDKTLNITKLEDIARVLANRTGQLFHPGNPILSCKMDGGHRVQIIAGFNTITGFILAIRVQRKEKFTIDDYQMTPEDRKAVIEAVSGKHTVLISGGTSTGKTSFMNAIIPFIPMHERLITLEDVPELRVPHRNWCPLLFSNNDTGMGNQDITDLLNATLRLRPDRILMGEIRKENAFTFCSAINTGHEGSMATIHANAPAVALDAVINRILLNGDADESALRVLRRQLIHDIYGVIQLQRRGTGVHAYFKVLKEGDADLESENS